MKAKICREAGCNCLINSTETYCSKHIKPKSAPFANATRSNDGLYNTTKWSKLRNKTLNEQPFCSKCGVGISEAKLHIHHIIPPRGSEDLFYNEENLVTVCEKCHRLLTNREICGRK